MFSWKWFLDKKAAAVIWRKIWIKANLAWKNSEQNILKDILLGHLNVNWLRNDLEYHEKIIKNQVDVFPVSECRLGLSFSDTQFQIANCNMFQKDWSKTDGGLLLNVNQDFFCNIVNMYNFPTKIEILPLHKKCPYSELF